MVARFAAALDVPLRQHNALLLAAGFRADLAGDRSRRAGTRTGSRARSITCWRSRSRFRRSRSTGTGTCSRRTQAPCGWSSSWSGRWRRMRGSIWPTPWSRPDVLRPYLVNWADVVRYFIRSVEADAAPTATGDQRTAGAAAALQGRATGAEAGCRASDERSRFAHAFSQGRRRAELFTTIATLGTPQDITLQELRVESFFPMESPKMAQNPRLLGCRPGIKRLASMPARGEAFEEVEESRDAGRARPRPRKGRGKRRASRPNSTVSPRCASAPTARTRNPTNACIPARRRRRFSF